jgi:hypothetical protein
MEVQKHKILLENSTNRINGSKKWGDLTATTFYINVFLTQNYDDMGLFTDITFISGDTNSNSVDYSILISKLISNGYNFPFMNNSTPPIIDNLNQTEKLTIREVGAEQSDFYFYGSNRISGTTDSKIDELKSYKQTQTYIPGFNISTEDYYNFQNSLINGVSKVISLGEPKTYAFDAVSDINIGTNNQQNGIYYKDYTGITKTIIIDGIRYVVPITTFNFKGEGINETNTSLSALTKEEYLFGVVSKPEIENDVFIERGVLSVTDKHVRMSEIKNLGELQRYGNGFYKITRE